MNEANLQSLFEVLRNSRDLAQIRAHWIPLAAGHFDATRAALLLQSEMESLPMPPAMRAQMEKNPVVRYLFERHAPVHEGVILGYNEWKSFCSRADHGHVLAGPIVVNGQIFGVLAFTRGLEKPAFDAQNLADCSALCLHLSAFFARQTPPEWSLSPRETEVVKWVREGLTNAQIAAKLGVSDETIKANLKNIFRKTGVKSRAQLAAKAR